MIALSLTLVGCWKSKMSIFCRACYHNALPFTQITEISIDNKVHLLLAPLSITRPKPFYGLRMGRVLLWPPTLSSVPHRPTACPLQPLSTFYNSWLLCNTTQCLLCNSTHFSDNLLAWWRLCRYNPSWGKEGWVFWVWREWGGVRKWCCTTR